MNIHSAQTLLALDMDGTAAPVGHDPAFPLLLADFKSLLAANQGLALVYATGRSLESAAELLAETALPRPRFLICDVGSTVHVPSGSRDWSEDAAYARMMSDAMSGREAADVLALLKNVQGLVPQPPANQGRWKASFEIERGEAGDPSLAEVKSLLDDIGLELSLVRSSCVFRNVDMLDILPHRVTKATGLEFVADKMGIGIAGSIYAGDSHNDLAALLAAGRAIVVGNAPAALRVTVMSQRDAATVILAEGEHLAGVLEGCRRFGLG